MVNECNCIQCIVSPYIIEALEKQMKSILDEKPKISREEMNKRNQIQYRDFIRNL